MEYWWESQKEGDHLEDQDVGGRILLRDRIVMVWTGLIYLRIGRN
jgi:hypothetical protein